MKKKITVITPTFNSANTILANLASVKNQKYKNLEHIIIDNKSVDGTLNLIKKQNDNRIKIVSEQDNGIYDAINKGIKLAKGEIISILHSDDEYYNNHTLLNVINNFEDRNIDIIYGDLLYTKKNNLNKIIRYWKSTNYIQGMFFKGWSPPHPSFFVKKKIYQKFGLYSTKIGNPADIELMYRFLELKKVNNKYINKILIKMRYGGKSNKNFFEILKQNFQILNFLNLKNPISVIKFIYFKFINRALQFINN
ncbi:glycosyltransferase family 2 protein [Candidatus Pelagibacter sp.]|nr:glycosyltransferase family 2 protein [Candidatus Pelagibacter sp.]